MPHTPEEAADGAVSAAVVRAQLDELRGFFAFGHLPPRLQSVSKPIGELAVELIESTTFRSFELVEALRLLLLAKDAAVRAVLLSDRVCGPPGPTGSH